MKFRVGARLGTAGLLILMAAAMLPGTVSGENLSLADAVRLARKNSPAILESEAKKNAARQAKREAWLNHLPAIQDRCHSHGLHGPLLARRADPGPCASAGRLMYATFLGRPVLM